MQTLELTHPKYLELKSRLAEIQNIYAAISLLHWDQATYMPTGGAAARGQQLATLGQIAHEKFTDGAIAQLLEDLRSYEADLPYDAEAACLIRLARRNCDRASKIPADYTARSSRLRSESYQVWAAARPENNFALVKPYLEQTLDLSREYASFFPGYEHIADPLVEVSDYGMTTASIRAVFAQLRQELVPIVEAIAAQPLLDNSCLHRHYPEADQITFSHALLKQVGYDLQRGRQDKTLHPFMTKFSIGDVRITTRIDQSDLSQGLFSTIHEMGHALYEQGNDPALESTPLAGGISSGVHESQSRLWENQVGRSRSFWHYFYPQLQAAFPNQLRHVPENVFYQAINQVTRSLIRTDADEVTYNLHVMIRFDLEVALLEGTLAVADLPQAWRDRYQTDLGIAPNNDRDGVLQDVHWYSGRIGGMFQGYTLGNLMSAQFFEAALAANPAIPTQIQTGNFQPLQDWLKENIYCHGRKFTAAELIQQVTHRPLDTAPLIHYIRQKYGDLYRI